MPKRSERESIERVIDANINRAKEGLRVCEEVARFIKENARITAHFKKVRHDIEDAVKSLPGKTRLLKARASLKDVGYSILGNELKRKGCRDIFSANIQRAKESIRALEEFSKIINIEAAGKFKKIRYFLYEIEKQAAKRLNL